MLPYSLHGCLFPSYPVLELEEWPGDDGTVTGDPYDLIDFLPAAHRSTGDNLPPETGTVRLFGGVQKPDARYVLHYLCNTGGFTLDGGANDTHAVLIVRVGIGQGGITPISEYAIPFHGDPATVRYMDAGLAFAVTESQNSGELEIHGRSLQLIVHTQGNAPASGFHLAAYLRPL